MNTKATVHCEAGEVELRLSPSGSWQLRIRSTEDRDWRLACSGDLEGGAAAPGPADTDEGPLRLGPVTVDQAQRRALVAGREIDLTAREFDLLALLASAPNRVFTKRELQRDIWDYRDGTSSRTLDSHASRVRCKLRDAGAPGLVVNCWGVGYRLWDSPGLTPASEQDAA